MQKKIIALAIATAISAPAFADNSNVTLYGVADMSSDIIWTGTSAANVAGIRKSNISSNVSRLGIKGTEDLNGLTVLWQIEQLVNMDNSGAAGNGLATRNTFLGFKADMGTFLLGRHDTPYKMTTRKLDVFADSIADNRSIMGGVGSYLPAGTLASVKSAAASFDGRQPDVIAYVSPSFSGLTIAAAAVNLNEGMTTVPAGNAAPTASQMSALSLGGMYDAGPFYGSLGYEQHKAVTATTLKESAWKLGAGYKLDELQLGFVYEKTKDNFGALVGLPAGADVLGHNAYYLSAKYNIGADAIKVAYTNGGKLAMGGVAAASANTGAKQFSLGYDYGVSKRTKMYALYSRISNQSAQSYGFSTAGSTAAAGTINGVGASPSVLSMGIRHTF